MGRGDDDTGDQAPSTTAQGDPDRLVTEVLGRRILQGLLDAVVLYGVALVVVLAAGQGYEWVREWVRYSYPEQLAPGQAEQIFFLFDVVDVVRDWLPAVLVAWALLYLVLAPWLLRGRSPAMLVLAIRVVTRTGGRPTIVAHLVRALGLAIEVGVPAYLLGLVVDGRVAAVIALLVPVVPIAMTREHTRLGDVLARTRVVWAPRY